MAAYYNEHDRFAAAWLRELIKAGQIAEGDVDERDILDVTAADVRGFTQCHFFAGIGGWSYALRLAGWPDDRPVWTGSCPCQGYSAAGKQQGAGDARNLWPAWFRLVRECRPVTVFGEQVANAAGHGWLDAVSTDLEGEAYAIGAVVLGAHSVGAPHLRQRLWFVAELVADSESARGRPNLGAVRGRETARVRESEGQESGWSQREAGWVGDCLATGELADADGWDAEYGGVQRGGEHGLRAEGRCAIGSTRDSERSEARNLGDADITGLSERVGDGRLQREAVGPSTGQDAWTASDGLGDTNCERSEKLRRDEPQPRSPWTDSHAIWCRDGKYRPTEPGLFPLAHGVPARVGRLRGYGNAIVPQVAAEVIQAYLECR